MRKLIIIIIIIVVAVVNSGAKNATIFQKISDRHDIIMSIE